MSAWRFAVLRCEPVDSPEPTQARGGPAAAEGPSAACRKTGALGALWRARSGIDAERGSGVRHGDRVERRECAKPLRERRSAQNAFELVETEGKVGRRAPRRGARERGRRRFPPMAFSACKRRRGERAARFYGPAARDSTEGRNAPGAALGRASSARRARLTRPAGARKQRFHNHVGLARLIS